MSIHQKGTYAFVCTNSVHDKFSCRHNNQLIFLVKFEKDAGLFRIYYLLREVSCAFLISLHTIAMSMKFYNVALWSAGTYIIGTIRSLSIKQKYFSHSYSHVLTLFSIIPSHFSSCAVQMISLRRNITETKLHFLLHSSV